MFHVIQRAREHILVYQTQLALLEELCNRYLMVSDGRERDDLTEHHGRTCRKHILLFVCIFHLGKKGEAHGEFP
jgi:hypothetical protein